MSKQHAPTHLSLSSERVLLEAGVAVAIGAAIGILCRLSGPSGERFSIGLLSLFIAVAAIAGIRLLLVLGRHAAAPPKEYRIVQAEQPKPPTILNTGMEQPVRLNTMEELLGLAPAKFELAVCALCLFWGYSDVQHTGGGGDLVADIVCHDTSGNLTVVQCKRYAPSKPVKSAEIQTFIGMLHVHHRAHRGVYVTTSGFTGPALELGRLHGVLMIDGPQLVSHMQRFYDAIRGNSLETPPR